MDSQHCAELDDLLISTQTDVHRMWELLLQPPGWRSTTLYVTFIGADRRPTRFLLEVTEADQVPRREEVAKLYDMLGHVVHGEPGGTAALLIARPGRGPLTDRDRLFATRLLIGAEESGVPVEPLHVATRDGIWALSPDDLAA